MLAIKGEVILVKLLPEMQPWRMRPSPPQNNNAPSTTWWRIRNWELVVSFVLTIDLTPVGWFISPTQIGL